MPSPIAISVRTVDAAPTDPAILVRDAVVLEPVTHPALAEVLVAAGATRRGVTTWSYQTYDGNGRNAVATNHAPLVAALRFAGANVVARRDAQTDRGTSRRAFGLSGWNQRQRLEEALDGAPNMHVVRDAIEQHMAGSFPDQPTSGAGTGLVSVSRDHHTIWLRVHTHHIGAQENEPDLPVPLNLRPAGRPARPPRPVLGAEAVRTIEWLQERRAGLDVVDHDGYARTLTSPAAARRLLSDLGDDPSLVLGDADVLRALLRVMGPDQVADLLHVGQADVEAAVDRCTDVPRKLLATAATATVVAPVPGKPAKALAHVGRRVPAPIRAALHAPRPSARSVFADVDVDAVDAAALAEVADDATHIDPAVLDVARMAAAPPHDDPRLYDYQNVFVGRFLATQRGLGNFSAPGAGKTPTTLAAYDAAARTTPSYRALVVCEANARFQWYDHANEWCPDFRVVLVDSRRKLDELRAVLADAGDDPVLVITSDALASDVAEVTDTRQRLADARTELVAARAALAEVGGDWRTDDSEELEDARVRVAAAEQAVTDAQAALPDPATHLGAALHEVAWHDLASDEAVGLRSSSKVGRALWTLRGHARRAVVLTGTPLNRDLDDVAKLLSWTFGDRRAWYGVRPTDAYDLSDPDQGRALQDDLGPTMFRVDKSEIGVALPQLSVQVVPLRLRREELALAEAARTQLKEKFTELIANLDLAADRAEQLAAQGDATAKAALADAKAALAEAKGAWLGSTTLARQAAADPVAMVASETAGAELLRMNGLVDAAVADMGTKRRWAVEYIDAAVDAGMQVVLFTEFGTVARALLGDLADRGVAAGAVVGGGGDRRDDAIRSFRAGDLDVLVCTSAGERGLNLQTRNGAGQVLIHYDLPWTASGVVQRTGRVERIGGADHVQVVFPIASGTIEDRVAGLVCARATAALQALDVPRGIDVADTDFGRALGTLALDVDASALRGGERALLEMTRALLADDPDTAGAVPLAA